MFLVGLTGGIGSGKSTVSSFLEELGIKVIDADKTAREVVEPDRCAWKRLRKEFGDQILLSDGTINRPLLGEIVFSDDERRKKLNGITHPEIYKSMLWKCFKLLLQGHQFVVLELPLLYESKKMTNYVHKVIVVTCDSDQQLTRLMKRNDFTELQARKRINAQMPLSEKCENADYIIDNSGDSQNTRKQIEKVVTELKNSHAHWKMRFLLLTTFLSFFGITGVIAYCVVNLII